MISNLSCPYCSHCALFGSPLFISFSCNPELIGKSTENRHLHPRQSLPRRSPETNTLTEELIFLRRSGWKNHGVTKTLCWKEFALLFQNARLQRTSEFCFGLLKHYNMAAHGRHKKKKTASSCFQYFLKYKLHQQVEDIKCRMSGQKQETVSHIMCACSTITQSLYTSRHDKILRPFYHYLLHL